MLAYTNEGSRRSLEKETGYLEVESGKSREILERGERLECKVEIEKLDRRIGCLFLVARY